MVVKTISLNKQFKIMIITFYYFPNTFDAKETWSFLSRHFFVAIWVLMRPASVQLLDYYAYTVTCL